MLITDDLLTYVFTAFGCLVIIEGDGDGFAWFFQPRYLVGHLLSTVVSQLLDTSRVRPCTTKGVDGYGSSD